MTGADDQAHGSAGAHRCGASRIAGKVLVDLKSHRSVNGLAAHGGRGSTLHTSPKRLGDPATAQRE